MSNTPAGELSPGDIEKILRVERRQPKRASTDQRRLKKRAEAKMHTLARRLAHLHTRNFM
ncbi:hypothetical protein ABZN20_18540 [Methylococcus sp. ANG]|uniref:hypothetical protein n=1 Tax=Methylococcus sp. ANG TaxID=3231903 RepID=UPI00345A6115